MDHLVQYYLHQAGHGAAGSRGMHDGIGPFYAASPFLQRGYGIGSFLTGLWRMVRPFLWSGAKTVARETFRTGGDILRDIARSTDDENPRDIISRRLNETAENLIGKLRGRGRKRKAGGGRGIAKRRQKGGKKPRLTKRDIFS